MTGGTHPLSVPAEQPLAKEVEHLSQRLHMPHLRWHAPAVLQTARAQRRDPPRCS
jgi:hypothetical protein